MSLSDQYSRARLVACAASFVAAAVVGSNAAQADPAVDYGGYSWITDRWAPTEFGGIGSYMGRDNVLHILLGEDGFASNRPNGYQPSFFDTQGRKTEVDLGPLPVFSTIDLYVPQAWKNGRPASEANSTAMWGTLFEPGTSNFDYPIIGFANNDQDGHFRIYDGNDYVNLPDAVKYDGWNTLRFELSHDSYDFYVNGKLVYSLPDATDDPDAYLKEVFLQSYNNGTIPYDVFYANLFIGMLLSQEEASFGAAPSTLSTYYQTQMLGDFASRRGVQPFGTFVPQNDMWARTGGFVGNFLFDNGASVDGQGGFIQGGLDLFEPFPGLSFGVTAQYGQTDGSDAFGGQATTESGGIGLYANYANDRFYADFTSMVSWENWSLTAAGGSGTTQAVTYAASLEGGAAVDIAPGWRIVPNAQLVFLSAEVDDLTFGGLVANYSTGDQLFGRVGSRLEFAIPGVGKQARGFVSASAVGLLSGNSDTVISGAALPGGNDLLVAGGFGDVAADLSSGIDIRVTDQFRLFGQTSARLGNGTEVYQASGGAAVKF